MFVEDVIDTSFKIPKVPALTPLFVLSHLIIHTCAKPSDADSGMCFTLFSVFYLCASTYACCPCRIDSPGHMEGVWISV